MVNVKRYAMNADGHSVECVEPCESAQDHALQEGALLLLAPMLSVRGKETGDAKVVKMYANGEWISAENAV